MKILKILYLATLTVFLISIVKIREFPPVEGVLPDLLKSPIQEDTQRQNFYFSYRGEGYDVKPVADYELWGLVVSKNNINAWYNFYHDKNSVNLKDLCVVWGENIKNGVYKDKNIKFKSGEWTCYSQWNGNLKAIFYPNNLSNNHLLTADREMQKILKDINIGDQIHLKGSLVDYAESGQAQYRMTSISREDSNQNSRSGGACEIVYVDKVEILKQNRATWHLINDVSKIIFICLLTASLIIFIHGYRKFLKK